MKNKNLIIFGMLFLIGIGIFLISAAGESYTIQGDSVFIDDAKVFINITPHTSNNPIIELTSKIYSGEIDIILGFNTSQIKPKGAETNPHLENVTKSYTCDYEFNYTTNPKHFWCFEEWSEDGEIGTYIHYERDFETGDLEEKTAYWIEEEIVWNDVSGAFNSVDVNFKGYDKWYYKQGISVTAGEIYKLKLDLQPQIMNVESHKYFFGVKPSDETLQEAIDNGHFYYIDPWTASLNEQLIAYYEFEESSGNAADSSEYGNTGIAGNIGYSATGKINDAYNFVADAGAYVNASTINSQMNGNEMSYNLWIKPSTNIAAETYIMDFRAITGGNKIILWWYGGNIRVDTRGNDSAPDKVSSCAINPLVSGTWYMLTMMMNGTHMRLVVDGSTDCGWTYMAGAWFTYAAQDEIVIGNWHNFPVNDHWSEFPGIIDEVAIYNRSLTDDEMDDFWNGGSGIEFEPPGPTDSCTYSSGDWVVDCADKCEISSPVNLGGNNLLLTGSGSFNVNEIISNFGEARVYDGCELRVYSSGGLNE